MDEWRQIDDTHYEVSMNGQVRNTQTGHILNNNIMKNGYHNVMLYRDGKPKNHYVHRLVLKAFRGDSDLEADHINHIRTDNRLTNLRWVTRSENNFNKDWNNTKVQVNNKCGMKNIFIEDCWVVVKIARKRKVVLKKRCNTVEEALRIRDEFYENERLMKQPL